MKGDYLYSETRPDPKGNPQDKIKAYGWEVVDKPGKLVWLPKTELRVDHEYQRSDVTNSRVNTIASKWSWLACGVITVAARSDGTYWVIDGQHRKLAADKRSDIITLPCMVFETTSKSQEAVGFLAMNAERGPVKVISQFNAKVMANDKFALAAKEMVESTGYTISSKGSDRTVKCIGSLLRAVKMDQTIAEIAWRLASDLYDGKPVIDRVFLALFFAERYMFKLKCGSLNEQHNREALMRFGPDEIDQSIRSAAAYHGSNSKSWAEGVIRLLNKGRRTRRISSPVDSSDVE